MIYKNRYIGNIIVIDINSITVNGITTIPSEVVEILNVKDSDELSWVVSNKTVKILKSSNVMKSGESVICKSKVKFSINQFGAGQWSIYIPSTVREIIYPMNDNITWLLDEEENIVARNTVLQNDCSRYIINKDIISIIVAMTVVSKKGQTTVPKDVTDIIGINNMSDTIYLNTENISIVNKSSRSIKSIKIHWVMPIHAIIYLGEDILARLGVSIGDKLIWIFDEYENISIRNNILPGICK